MNKKLVLRVNADPATGNLVRAGTSVRRHRLTKGEVKEALLKLRIPRAANAARISVGPESGFSPIGAEHAIVQTEPSEKKAR